MGGRLRLTLPDGGPARAAVHFVRFLCFAWLELGFMPGFGEVVCEEGS